jgi:hypothetical protein
MDQNRASDNPHGLSGGGRDGNAKTLRHQPLFVKKMPALIVGY